VAGASSSTTGDPGPIGFCNSGGLIGFRDATAPQLTGESMVGGVPGVECCC
jgi:hypothetical protein